MSRYGSNSVLVRFVRPKTKNCYLCGISPLNRLVFGSKSEARRFPTRSAAKQVIRAGGYKPSSFCLIPVEGLCPDCGRQLYWFDGRHHHFMGYRCSALAPVAPVLSDEVPNA